MSRKMIGLALSLVFLALITGGGGNISFTSSPQQKESAEVKEPEINSVEQATALETGQENSILVAYFSATGTTEQVAQQAKDTIHKRRPFPPWEGPWYLYSAEKGA